MDDEAGRQVKRMVLPSGKTIEVVLFAESPAAEPTPAESPPAEPTPAECPAAEPPQDLGLCAGCGCAMVFPAEWEEADPRAGR